MTLKALINYDSKFKPRLYFSVVHTFSATLHYLSVKVTLKLILMIINIKQYVVILLAIIITYTKH